MQKTKHQLVVPLCQKAIEWMPERGSCTDDMPVFTVPCISACNRALKHMAEKAGIKKDITFHSARHQVFSF